ncbi:hypothetical protein [Streptomyces sp. URMC 123]|uniref:hypothetical protein n=1 Tax=Streptomyces sp. URMC 123 TaxID=3423403 RepID=UPI003F1AE675
MSPGRPVPPRDESAAAGIARLEGYLLWHAETDRARAHAEAFADRMPWLTAAQRREVVLLCVDDRLATARAALEQVADRCRALRREYAERYEALRRRLLLATVTFSLALAALHGAVLLVDAR